MALSPTTAVAVASFAAIHINPTNRHVATAERDIIHPEGPEGARRFIRSILVGSETKFRQQFRMTKQQFRLLTGWFRRNTDLEESRHLLLEQKILVFLWICAFNETQRQAANFFGISQSTVSAIFHEVLGGMQKLHRTYVRLPDDQYISPEVEFGDKKVRAFAGCIGAVDGTLLKMHVRIDDQQRWRSGRKGILAQNVFAAVRFDGSFSYVLAGAEGSMHDARLCTLAFSRGFRVPDGRYYLADAGFGNRSGLIVPFQHCRYHLQDWRDSQMRPENARELYNLRHSRLRTCVEQVFGMLKRRWKIIRDSAPEYSIEDQINIVYAVTALHNFMQRHTDLSVAERARARGHGYQRKVQEAQDRATRLISGKRAKGIREQTSKEVWGQWLRYIRRRR